MSDKEFDVYFSLNQKKLSTGVFKKLDDSLAFFNEDSLEINSLEKSIEKNIKEVEKKIDAFVNNIFLMIDTEEKISIYISLMKKLDNKKIQIKDIQHLIQDAKQQIVRAHNDKSIVHIIVNKYNIDGLDYTSVPSDISCDKISIDVEFICFPKNLIKKIELLFNNFQISIDKIICSNYAKSFVHDKDESNICQVGYNLNKHLNTQEVVIVPKKLEKKGFFEKLFHLFE